MRHPVAIFLYLLGSLSLIFAFIGYIDAATRTVEDVNVGLPAQSVSTLLLLTGVICIGAGGIIDSISELREDIFELFAPPEHESEEEAELPPPPENDERYYRILNRCISDLSIPRDEAHEALGSVYNDVDDDDELVEKVLDWRSRHRRSS